MKNRIKFFEFVYLRLFKKLSIVCFEWNFIHIFFWRSFKTIFRESHKENCLIVCQFIWRTKLKKWTLSHFHKIYPVYTTLFWHPYDVVLTLWTLYGRQNDVVCLLGFSVFYLCGYDYVLFKHCNRYTSPSNDNCKFESIYVKYKKKQNRFYYIFLYLSIYQVFVVSCIILFINHL